MRWIVSILRSSLFAVSACCLAVLAVPGVSHAVGEFDPDQKFISLDYEAYFGGMHIGSVRADISLRQDAYRVEGVARARGILDWFSEWRGTAVSHGGLTDWRDPRPIAHENEGHWRGKKRWLKMTYLGEGRIDVDEESPPDQNELTPIPRDALIGTIDPISALVGTSGILAEGGACTGALKMYDGRRRYNLSVTDRGTRTLEPNEYNIYDGETRLCAVDVDRIGGFRKEQSKYSKTARDREVMVAKPFPESPPLPVRINVETAFGTLVVHLSAARMDGREIAVRPGWDNQADE